MRGKVKRDDAGKQFLKTEARFAVFDNIPGSPRYWQKIPNHRVSHSHQNNTF